MKIGIVSGGATVPVLHSVIRTVVRLLAFRATSDELRGMSSRHLVTDSALLGCGIRPSDRTVNDSAYGILFLLSLVSMLVFLPLLAAYLFFPSPPSLPNMDALGESPLRFGAGLGGISVR